MSKKNKLKNKNNRLNFNALKTSLETNPELIQLIDNPSEELQLIAVNADANALKYIKEPTDKVIKLANEKMQNKDPMNDMVKNAVIASATMLVSTLIFKKIVK